MRKFLSACSVMAVLATFGVVANPLLAGAGGSSNGKVAEKIYLTLENDGFYESKLPDAEPKIGDVSVFHDKLFRTDSNFENPREVGADSGMCQVTLVEGPVVTSYCFVTLKLQKGQIVVAAQWPSDEKDLTMAIVGGTGAYATARGEMIVNNVAAAESEVIRIMK